MRLGVTIVEYQFVEESRTLYGLLLTVQVVETYLES